jgi:hypothetical protein
VVRNPFPWAHAGAPVFGTYVSPIVRFVTFRWYYPFSSGRDCSGRCRHRATACTVASDRTGGQDFANLGYALTMFAVAHGATITGYVASRIFLAGTVARFRRDRRPGRVHGGVIFGLCWSSCRSWQRQADGMSNVVARALRAI